MTPEQLFDIQQTLTPEDFVGIFGPSLAPTLWMKFNVSLEFNLLTFWHQLDSHNAARLAEWIKHKLHPVGPTFNVSMTVRFAPGVDAFKAAQFVRSHAELAEGELFLNAGISQHNLEIDSIDFKVTVVE